MMVAAAEVGCFAGVFGWWEVGVFGWLMWLEIFDDSIAGGGGDKCGDGDEDRVDNDGGKSEGGDEQDDEGDAAVGDGEGDVAD